MANTKIIFIMKCQGCSKELSDSKYTKKTNGDYQARCESCRQKRIKSTSEHKRNYCKECGKQACFNVVGETFGIYCKAHKEPDMVNVRSKKCKYDGCKTRSNFNNPGEKQGLYCKTHKEPEMVDIRSKRCEYNGCKKLPIFNKEGETFGIYCKAHKEADMVNVKNKRCKYNGCTKQPAFNKPGETKGLYCKTHKEPDMVNIKNKRCKYDGCKKQPKFNKLGETKGLYCKEHKEPGMVDIKNKKCEYDGCIKQPNFNKPGETKGLYCKKHKEPDMVNVKNKKCEYKNCKTTAWYGIPGNQSSRCAKHPEANMIKNPRTTCLQEDCKEIALYGGSSPVHCEQHKLEDEIDLVCQKCKICGLVDIVNSEGICGDHDETLRKRTYLQKQKRVKVLIENDKYCKEFKLVSYDLMIDKGICSKRRPDFVFDAGDHFVVLEIDENQHTNYTQECEKVRMAEIHQSLGMPTIFIRYNPDPFTVNGVKSMMNKSEREDTLIKWLRKCMNLEIKPNEHIHVLYLFYNEYKHADTRLKLFDSEEYLI